MGSPRWTTEYKPETLPKPQECLKISDASHKYEKG